MSAKSLTSFFLTTIFSFLTISITAQEKLNKITLEDIWQKGTFRTERLQSLKTMEGDFYTVLEFNRETRSTNIDQYSFADQQKVASLLDSKDIKEIDYFENYSFSKDESKVLLTTESEPIYRRSENAIFYVYNLKDKSLQKISENKIQVATFSPDGQKVAYVYQNNIYIKDLNSKQTIQVTHDGKINEIINGITDWVYEEEFGFVRAFQWNKDGTHLAFLRFDEREVPEFSMMKYGKKLYPEAVTFKYPKAGEKNSKVSLHIYNVAKAKTKKIDLGDYEYIPRIKWTKDKNLLSVQTLNRKQNDLKLFFVNAKKSKSDLMLEERADTYINIRNTLTFLSDNSFIWRSEQDGFDHLYYYSKKGKLINQITKGSWDMTKFYGVDEENKKVFYQSTEGNNINRSVYSINLNGKQKKLLSSESGTSDVTFSRNKKYYILNYSDANTPTTYTLHSADGKKLKDIMDNAELKDLISTYQVKKKEFSQLTTKTGTFNMYMIKPADFDPTKKYPVFMYQYSGPGVQTVINSWHSYNDYWHLMLTEMGYIVVSVDGRGTGGRGSDFTKMTYKQLGKYETIDQIEAAKSLAKLPYVDAERIGIWGWSFGGFTSANALFKGNDVFKMAIAVAPVTNWRLYDTVYTERYMQTPQENPDGYDDNSPLFFADQLKPACRQGRGNFLLIHGSGDDNVHVQNTYQLIDAMIQADVPFDSEIYPDRTHGIYRGQNTRLHLYKKMTRFIVENL